MMEKVRCADCGLLAARNGNTRELEEVETSLRQATRISLLVNANKQLENMVCFVMANDLIEECRKVGKTGDYAWAEVLSKERVCSNFTRWKQGHSPREHSDMLTADEVRKQAAEQKARDLAWQEEQREKDRAWQLEQKRKDRVWQLIMLAISVSIGLLGFFARSLFDWLNK